MGNEKKAARHFARPPLKEKEEKDYKEETN